MPSQTFTASATAPSSAERVWESLDDPQTWESIGGVDRVFDPRIDEQGRLQGFSFESVAAGKRYVGQATPAAREEGRLIAWNVVNSEIRGITAVTLAPDGPDTTITVRLEVESIGFLSGMFFGIIAGVIGNGLPEAVADFAAGFGTERVQPF